ncbi:bifunctional 4-hydroxy-2-oxoglutarate aldolase/2-dehydro-3-deoxy-phosphogluconate aldolase [Viridibacillus arvi]|uniref:bifunctional 4-hydroxy-2-oxoglutarate aldolase/2-dehydro-3-deoxy-phosphogluconate aldolase n=1 Tax=Viridibacillus arvi TaxID=263475 RepID=UPI003D2901F3
MNILSSIQEQKIVTIIRNVPPRDILKVVSALSEGGISVIEITLNSPNALSMISEVTAQFGDKVIVGAGTVLDSESARAAILAGAKFIVSPTVDEETIKMTKRYGAISIPGAFTPTEILKAYEAGGDIIKVFPASLGTSYIKNILAPLPQIPLLPTGGIDETNINQFIKAGAIGCGIGSSLVNADEKINEEYLTQLTKKAKRLLIEVNKG